MWYSEMMCHNWTLHILGIRASSSGVFVEFFVMFFFHVEEREENKKLDSFCINPVRVFRGKKKDKATKLVRVRVAATYFILFFSSFLSSLFSFLLSYLASDKKPPKCIFFQWECSYGCFCIWNLGLKKKTKIIISFFLRRRRREVEHHFYFLLSLAKSKSKSKSKFHSLSSMNWSWNVLILNIYENMVIVTFKNIINNFVIIGQFFLYI